MALADGDYMIQQVSPATGLVEGVASLASGHASLPIQTDQPVELAEPIAQSD